MHTIKKMKKKVNVMADSDTLVEIRHRLDNIDTKLNVLLVKEEKPTKADLRAIRQAERDIAEGKVVSWEKVKQRLK